MCVIAAVASNRADVNVRRSHHEKKATQAALFTVTRSFCNITTRVKAQLPSCMPRDIKRPFSPGWHTRFKNNKMTGRVYRANGEQFVDYLDLLFHYLRRGYNHISQSQVPHDFFHFFPVFRVLFFSSY